VNTRAFEGSILVPFADQVNHESHTLIAPCLINTELHKNDGYREYEDLVSVSKAKINISGLLNRDLKEITVCEEESKEEAVSALAKFTKIQEGLSYLKQRESCE
jgi:hypothetical protein